jgi:hypothetical protein
MTTEKSPDLKPSPAWATPNALAILVAMSSIPELKGTMQTDDVGYALMKNASWVLRYGRILEQHGLAHFSRNGHCWLERKGEIEALALLDVPCPPPPSTDYLPGPTLVGSRALYRGHDNHHQDHVYQYVPAALPGYAPVDLPPRAKSAHHKGCWIEIGALHHRFVTDLNFRTLEVNQKIDVGAGAGLERGRRITNARLAALSKGIALVALPGGEHPARMVRTSMLLQPGAPDPTALNDFQSKIAERIGTDGCAMELDPETQQVVLHVDGTKILPRTVEILEEHGWIDRSQIPVAVSPAGPRR